MSDHWALPFIGHAYAAAGDGPHAFNCWSFFRHVERRQFAREIPAVPVPDGLCAAMRLFRDQPDLFGWQKIEKPLRPSSGDVVLMGHRHHPHHIGVYVDDVSGGAVLHCVEGAGSVLHSLFHLDIGGWNITGIYRPIDGEASMRIATARST